MATPTAALRVRCPAKLNLFLEVLRRRPDGYHDIDTVMQAIDLYDELHIHAQPAPEITLECDDPALPTDERNLVIRAALALRDLTGTRAGAHIALAKRIPAQAGLGGGSSDAAGTLLGLNAAWQLALPIDTLATLAARLGSDVPFFLHGATARCTGRGERIEPLPARGRQHYVLLCPPVAVSTAEAYKRLRFPLTSARAGVSMVSRHLAEDDVEGLGAMLHNRLEDSVFGVYPRLCELKAVLVELGLFAGVCMTGSGSALYGVCQPPDWQHAAAHVARLGLGWVSAVHSVDRGAQVTPV